MVMLIEIKQNYFNLTTNFKLCDGLREVVYKTWAFDNLKKVLFSVN